MQRVLVCSHPSAVHRQVEKARQLARMPPGERLALSTSAEDFEHFCQSTIQPDLDSQDAASSRDPVCLEVVLATPDDYQLVREVWLRLRPAAAALLTLRLTTPGMQDAAQRAAANLVIDLDDHSPLHLQNKLAVLSKSLGEQAATLVCSQAPLYLLPSMPCTYLTRLPEPVLLRLISGMKLTAATRLCFLRNAQPDLHRRIPRSFWKTIFASSIPDVESCGDDLTLRPLRLFEGKIPNTLFIFPERMLPLQRAYYLRAFDVLLGLNYSGLACAAFVLGPHNNDLHRIQKALEIISPCVFTQPLTRGRPPAPQKWLRHGEMMLRSRMGIKTPPPMRFSERCHAFATPENADAVLSVAVSLPALRHVIYTGAWFTPAIKRLKHKLPGVEWICDAHDVFFQVDRDANQAEKRFFYNPASYKRLELELLASADAIIAISPSDRTSLVQAGCKTPVMVEYGSFSHVFAGGKNEPGEVTPVFGFIGSGNRNNEKCLQIIGSTWWPAILALYPRARLRVAGAICKSPTMISLQEKNPESVESAGFVACLSDYYHGVHAMLSPIAVQGGLNFKSVEALMAGRPLITNEMGSRCIGEGQAGVYVVDETLQGLSDILEELLRGDTQSALRGRIRNEAEVIFGDNVAYQHLLSHLQDQALAT